MQQAQNIALKSDVVELKSGLKEGEGMKEEEMELSV